MRHIRCTTLPWAAGLALFVSSSHTVPGALALDTLDPLFSVSGNLSVDAAGDVNNDGTPDVISGDSSAGGSFRGKAWVTSGADGTNLYTFEPPPGMTLAFLGHSVAGIDDLNGDDHADVVVSMYAENTVFIYSGFDGEVLETLKQDSGGFGFTLANAGDVNNDDINDLIVGDQHGRAFLYSGADRSLLHTWETGESEVAVDGAGDVNRDGHDDIILGLSHHSRIDRNRGRIEVYSGSDYRRIYAFDGGRQDEFFGHDVDTAGDLNFDGHADFIAGSLYAGVVRVYSGIDGDELYTWDDGAGTWFGDKVAGGGDVDGDSIPDLLIAAANIDTSYVYSGRTGERIFKIDGTNVAWSPDMTNDGIGDVMTNAYAYSGKRLRPDFFGPVPGLSGEVNTFTVSDVVAGNSVYLIYGQRDGTAAIPGCPPDAFVDISAPVVFGSSIANPDGVATFRVNVPASANERTVLFQAAVPASCRVTPIVRHTFRDALPTVLLVDDDAGDGGTGWAWASAFQSVRAAVDAAVELGTVTDVWVAEGTYVATVHLANGVAVYGGFRGNEATRDQRRPDRFISTLSGDNRLSPVVRALDVDGTARLDGLSIVDGASGTGAYAAGIDIENASPTIVNCVLSGHGGNRGAVEVTSGNPTFVDCRFTDNMVNFGGGSALTVWAGGPTFERCNFVGNSAQDAGGAAYISGGDTVFNRCVFDRNEIFNGEEGGGALYVFGGRMTLVNSIMTRNDARSWLEVGGGAIYIGRGSGVVEIINSLLAGNTADAWGDAAYNNAILTVSNSIIWSNSIETSRYGSTTVTYSNGDQAFAGVGNISAIPMFVDPFGGDFRLMPGSPCIDAASNSAVPIWVDLDFAGRPRFVDDPDTPDTGEGDPPVVDMGPHEFQP